MLDRHLWVRIPRPPFNFIPHDRPVTVAIEVNARVGVIRHLGRVASDRLAKSATSLAQKGHPTPSLRSQQLLRA